ncbi:TIGR03985 family CRISPR-associated protein (plasmid) [Nostoc edaphicum CCNP1411]|uniref:TIGR03985 family CRISPR-associated protein n=1 Tax=Nostoc edaphicum CCNP1411 TaxID=1472755 RepID=A0A7D7LB51_9NOSO|nr:TIGR03985 family CRISPR-associated protein [Nostoc edaphicum]QMS86112.1 TIGR03985 family CRISPR-associated protein [Nostoc edaphicum CCNP1411]
MTQEFYLPPTPQILQWLAGGQLANRLVRSLRLLVLIDKLYSGKTDWADKIPRVFTYSQLRDRLFAYRHPKNDRLNAQQITVQCSDIRCICHQTFSEIVFEQNFQQSEAQWLEQIILLTGINKEELQKVLQERPFATVHRSIRDDLKQLIQLGWLHQAGQGKYQYLAREELPQLPTQLEADSSLPKLTSLPSLSHLSEQQTWELLRVLESISFVQPNLSSIIEKLWQQITDSSPSGTLHQQDPQQRIFLHLDYILSPQMQDCVDNYQEQIEQLWYKPPGGVVQFEYWIAATESKVKITVYPVCLHYVRRAKYLSAYGIDPDGNIAWHNYRLDRIAGDRVPSSVGDRLKVLAWGDPLVPQELKQMWHTGSLPTPEYIAGELKAAWGFNFYFKKELLILRFPADFAKWYVDNTTRHSTFRAVLHNQLPQLIVKNIPNEQEREQLLKIVSQCPTDDAYYIAWIRTGDINVLMRLREWRPNGEVIAPLSIRYQMRAEAEQEFKNYQALLG